MVGAGYMISGLCKGTVGWKIHRLAQYLEAEQAILQGQAYTLDGRSVTRADLSAVRAGIKELEAEGITPEGLVPKRRTLRAVYDG